MVNAAPVVFDRDRHTEIGNEGAVILIEKTAVDDIVLGDPQQHAAQRNHVGCLFLGDSVEMAAEPGLGRGPVGDGVVVLAHDLGVFLPPVALGRGIALEIDGLGKGLAVGGIKNELGQALGKLRAGIGTQLPQGF